MPPGEAHPSLVLLTVDNESALAALHETLSDQGITCSLFHEEDMGGQLTALATAPVEQSQRKLFRDLPMLGS